MDIPSIKKESIVFTTIDIINESGFQGLATREVARRQGISQATVFQYFPKKIDLISAVLDHYSFYDNDLFESAKNRSLNPKEALIYYIDTYTAYNENYPAITSINEAYEAFQNDPNLGDKVKSIFQRRYMYMKELLEEAQAAGMMKKEVDIDVLTDIITSTQRGICLKWRLEEYSFSLREKTLQAITMLLTAFFS